MCPECRRVYNREWSRRHRDTINEYLRGYNRGKRRNKRDAVYKAISRYRNTLEGRLANLYCQAKSRHNSKSPKFAKIHRLGFDVDQQYINDIWTAQYGRCAISGLEMVYKSGDLCCVSIDRIDSSIGYVKGNIQLVCAWVNRAKNTATNDEMIRVIELLQTKSIKEI